MFVRRHWTAALVLAALFALAVSASAAAPRVNDEAKFFSPEAVEKANQKLREIQKDYGKDLLIETVPAVPPDLEARYKEEGKQKFFRSWAEERAEKAGVKGVYILLSKKPGHVQIVVDKATQRKAFTRDDHDRLMQKVLPLLKEHKNDEALREMVDFVEATLRANQGRKGAAGGAAVPHNPAQDHPVPGSGPPMGQAGGSSILRWVCVGVGALLVIWVIFAIIRAFSGGGGGYAGAGGGGWGGGGGGGFFTSLLGGLFGAAAGSWIYDSFFRHDGGWGGSEAHGGTFDQGATSAGDEAGAGDFSGDQGAGGDFDGGDASGDAGGGDFGGGDFGGGDFGGDFGGGDFGGGDF